jgi:aminomethyltransferase
MNQRTALYERHLAHTARMVPFGGWDMPVQYSSVLEEHAAVRNAVGLFDISHMARLNFHGAGALAFLESVFTNRVDTLQPGQVRYGLLCNSHGGIKDDVLVYRVADQYAMVVNASNRAKILAHFADLSPGHDVSIEDVTDATAMIAIQGPGSVAAMRGLVADDVSSLKYYFAMPSQYQGAACTVSRTGYTGEDGFEVIVPNALAVPLWNELLARGAVPCGLGARDTLRLEAAMPLYGHELLESIDPVQAGLGWAVKLNKGAFIGREALQQLPVGRVVRMGLLVEGKRAAREGSLVLVDGATVGRVTSGSFVPHLQQSIAMAYLPPQTSGAVTIDVRGSSVAAHVVPLPFYQRAKS